MGVTIEFFSANPQDLVDIFTLEDVDVFVEKLSHYPIADFSIHLEVPRDMDRLCQSMRLHNLFAPSVFRELLVKQLWYNGSSESLTLIAESFVLSWKDIDDHTLESIAQHWATEFHYQEQIYETPAYKALFKLREITQDIFSRNTSLVLHLLGSPLF